jgi:apolipoprotein N-acyltransferase
LLVALAGPRRVTLGRAFTLGLLTGVVHFAGTLYWITHVMNTYGELPIWVAVALNGALVGYLALFPAVFAVIVRRIVVARGTMMMMGAPLVWVATELGRTYLLTGFPWVLLGYSQASVLPIAQLASIFGVYGVSMLVASVSAAVAILGAGSGSAEKDVPGTGRFVRFVPLAASFAGVLGVAVWGSQRAATGRLTHEGSTIRVGIVQGNVDQGQKWDPAHATAIFQDYLRKSRQALREGANLVLWPESSTPFMFEEDAVGAEQVRMLARQARVPILLGSDQIEWRTVDNKRIPDKYFNSAFLVRPDGSTAGAYRKMHLVPFGEYVPFQRLLFFAAPLTEQVGTFSPGLAPALLDVEGHPVSVAICYEVVYPSLVRQFVAAGSELLTTITNDAWFGSTSAPYQHFEQASMRAIEEGRYLVRAANTGISGIVDPYGRVLDRTGIFQAAVLVGDVRFLRASTFYGRHGDVLAYAAAAVTLLMLVAGGPTTPRRVE